jgi:hypothetical protein
MTSPSNERFAIVSLAHGPAPAEALVIGPMTEVFQYIGQSVARNDAIEEVEKARFSADQIAGLQEKTRGVQASMVAEAIKHLDQRMDALVKRRADAVFARQRRDEEEEQQRIQAELDQLPDPDAPPLLLSKTPDPPQALEDEEQPGHGDPPGVPVSQDEAEFPDPDATEPAGSVFPQPIAAGLD